MVLRSYRRVNGAPAMSPGLLPAPLNAASSLDFAETKGRRDAHLHVAGATMTRPLARLASDLTG